MVIPVIYDNQKYVLMLNPNGSIYRQIIEQLTRKLRESGNGKVKEIRLFIKKASGRYTVAVDVAVESSKAKKQK